MLSREEVELYRRDGYLPGRRLLSAAEAERFRDDCLRTCAEPLVLGDQNPCSLKRHASNRVKPYLLFPWAAELVRHASILDLVEAVIGPDILVFHTTVWLKPPRSENYVPWHQDATYFRTGTVRAHHRLGGADALAAGERLCRCHPRYPPRGPACPFRRSQRRAHDVVAWAEACPRNPRRGCGGPRTRRCITAPHAYRAQFGHEPERRLADRHRHQLHSDPRAPHRAEPAVRDTRAGHRPLQPFRPRGAAPGRTR